MTSEEERNEIEQTYRKRFPSRETQGMGVEEMQEAIFFSIEEENWQSSDNSLRDVLDLAKNAEGGVF